METIDSSPSFQLVSTTDLGGAPEKPGQVKIRLTIALAVPAGEWQLAADDDDWLERRWSLSIDWMMINFFSDTNLWY